VTEMKTYIVKAKMDTYAECTVLANSPEEASEKADQDMDVDWSYDTDYDSSKTYEVTELDEKL